MVSIFSTGKANNKSIKNFKDPKLKDFEKAVHQVLLNLAKRVAVMEREHQNLLLLMSLNAKVKVMQKKFVFQLQIHH